MGGVKRTLLSSLISGQVASSFHLVILLSTLNIFRYLEIFRNGTTKCIDNITQYNPKEFIFSSMNKGNLRSVHFSKLARWRKNLKRTRDA